MTGRSSDARTLGRSGDFGQRCEFFELDVNFHEWLLKQESSLRALYGSSELHLHVPCWLGNDALSVYTHLIPAEAKDDYARLRPELLKLWSSLSTQELEAETARFERESQIFAAREATAVASTKAESLVAEVRQAALAATQAFIQFDGTGDFAAWIERFAVVSRVHKVTDLASVLPLFLNGGSFAVYQCLGDTDKAEYGAIKRALTSAFLPNCFQAYGELTWRRLRTGESINVYASELARLFSLVAPPEAAEAATTAAWLKCAFVAGLPDNIKKKLKAVCSLSTMNFLEVIERARQLVAAGDV